MNWEAISAIGQIVGALAVVVSLIYLASQIRMQNREARAASVHQVIEGHRSSLATLLDPEMADIWTSGIDDIDSLSPSQRLRFVVHLMLALRSFEDAYFQWREGRLESDTWNSLVSTLKSAKSTAGFNWFWGQRRHYFRESFAAYVDNLEGKQYWY